MIHSMLQEGATRGKEPGDWHFALNGRSSSQRSFGALLAATERGEVVPVEPGRVQAWPFSQVARRRPGRRVD